MSRLLRRLIWLRRAPAAGGGGVDTMQINASDALQINASDQFKI